MKELKVQILGNDSNDLATALWELLGLVENGFSAGSSSGETVSFSFKTTELKEEEEEDDIIT